MSWVTYEKDHPFPIQNIPFGAFVAKDGSSRCCSRIADFVIDLKELATAGVFNAECNEALKQPQLNKFMSLGRPNWRHVREKLQLLLAADNTELQSNDALKAKVLVAMKDAKMTMPATVGDYTDFYSSREHATNVGKMFRPTQAPLLPNWLHLPVGYHGRSSSIVVSGTPVRRPLGQTRPDDEKPPVFGPCRLLDMEIEVGAWVGTANELGEPVSIDQTQDTIFGLTLFNDWSARDIQKWEYVPLGPFLAKSFASTISPWIITLDALEPFRCEGPKQGPAGGEGIPEVMPYLQQNFKGAFDIELSAAVKPQDDADYSHLSTTNFKYMYWSVFQQLAHHTVNGCNMRPGDLYASGTISGPTKESYGSMLELTWRGRDTIKLQSGKERKFFQDGDSVLLNAACKGPEFTIGFGECEGSVLPAPKY